MAPSPPPPKPLRRQRLLRELRAARRSAARIGAGWIRAFARQPVRTAPVLLVILAAAATATTGLRGKALLDEQLDRRAALLADVRALEGEAAALRRDIARLRDDPAALELLAKTRHHLVEPGEVVVLLRFPETTGPPTPPGYSMR